MKAVLFLIATAIAVGCNAQHRKLSPEQQEYLRRSKNNKISGVACVVGGAALIVLGISKLEFHYNLGGTTTTPSGYQPKPDNTADILILTGLGLEALSIPLFIASGKNKRRAASLSFKNNYGLYPQLQGIAVKRIPSLSVAINL